MVSAGHGVNADCGVKPICGECGSGKNEDCHGYSHQAKTLTKGVKSKLHNEIFLKGYVL